MLHRQHTNAEFAKVQSISHIAHKVFTSALVLIDHKIPDSPLCRLVLLLAATTMNTVRLTQQHAHCLLRLCEIKLTGSATAVLPRSFLACLMHKSQTTWCHIQPQVSTVSAYKEMRAPAKMTGSNHSASSLRLSLFDPGTASLPLHQQIAMFNNFPDHPSSTAGVLYVWNYLPPLQNEKYTPSA